MQAEMKRQESTKKDVEMLIIQILPKPASIYSIRGVKKIKSRATLSISFKLCNLPTNLHVKLQIRNVNHSAAQILTDHKS